MKRIIGIIVLLALTNVIYAETAPDEVWNKTFGGINRDCAWSVQQTSDGGYIVAGDTYSYGSGNGDSWLVKTDSNGNKQWDKTFGGLNRDSASSVQQTSDGGYIVAGYTESHSASYDDFWLVKTDPTGNKVWNSTFGGNNGDSASSVQQTSDGGYIVAGDTYSYGSGNGDFLLVKTDSNGNKQWNKTFGGIAAESANSVQQTTDGGYILAGYTGYCGGYDFWLVKTDSNGNKMWEKSFGGTDDDLAWSVQQTSDGGYILAGSTGSYDAGDWDVWLVKTDSSGNKQWDKTVGGTDDDWAFSVQQTSDGGYIFAGSTESYSAGYDDFWLVKTDSNGNKVWDATYGGTCYDRALSVQQTSDGGYILVGYMCDDFWLIKVGGDPILTPTPSGYIYVQSDPSGAYIYLDSVYAGTAPATILDASPGSHTIKLTKSGYADYTTTAYVLAGATESIDATLTQETGSISISSAPSGADIHLNGAYKGTTPATIPDVSPGAHALKLEKYGYEAWLTSVHVTSGVTESITAHLAPADVSPPAIRIDKPVTIDQNDNGLLEEGEKVEITYGANDPGGVASIKLLLDGALLESQNRAGTYTVTTSSLLVGTHTIRVEATDSRSNSCFEETYIIVERTGPSVYFGTAITAIKKGEDAIFTLSAVNPIGNPAMTVQLILKPPSGVSVTSSSFAKAGAGIYTCTQTIESGDNVRSIEVHLTGNQAGTHEIASEVYYMFGGGSKSPTRYETLTLIVKPERPTTTLNSREPEKRLPGFGVVVAGMILFAIYLRRKRA